MFLIIPNLSSGALPDEHTMTKSGCIELYNPITLQRLGASFTINPWFVRRLFKFCRRISSIPKIKMVGFLMGTSPGDESLNSG
jgi:hypothetical protein